MILYISLHLSVAIKPKGHMHSYRTPFCLLQESNCKQSRIHIVGLPFSTHSSHIMTKVTSLAPAIKLSYLHSRGWEERKRKYKACSFISRTPSRSFTFYIHSHSTGYHLVTWSFLATREDRNCNICAWQPWVHLKFDGSISKRRGNI